MADQIKVKVNGGYLIAKRNPNPSYDGIDIVFETDKGDMVNIVGVESPDETERKVTNVYTYEDEYDESVTRKYVIKHDNIHRALYEE